MGQWILTIVGKEQETDLSDVFSSLVDDLNDKGHKVTSIRVRTDAGETTVDLEDALNSSSSTIEPTTVDPDTTPTPTAETQNIPETIPAEDEDDDVTTSTDDPEPVEETPVVEAPVDVVAPTEEPTELPVEDDSPAADADVSPSPLSIPAL